MPDLLYEKKDHYAIFTMNRPERLNALGGSMREELRAALDDFAGDPDMRVAVVTGAGRAFCAGMDLRDRAEQVRAGTFVKQPVLWENLPFRFSRHPKPFIAAVNGAALAGGMEMALDCDIRICSTEAYFGQWEPRRGTLAGYSIHHLPRMIPSAAASYVLLTADRISAEQAKEWFIVTEVLPPDQLMSRAVEIAELVAANAPLAVQGTKAQIQQWRLKDIDESFRLSQWIYKANIDTSEDLKEGALAFAEKRPPVWKGR